MVGMYKTHEMVKDFVLLFSKIHERCRAEKTPHHRNIPKYPPLTVLFSLLFNVFPLSPASFHTIGPECVLWTVAVGSVVIKPEANANS